MNSGRSAIGLFAAFVLLSVPAPSSAQDENLLPPGPGRDTVIERCTLCHSVKNMIVGRMPADYWQMTVDEMAALAGWAENDPAKKVVLDYLITVFGPNAAAPKPVPAPAPAPKPAAPAPPAAPQAADNRRIEGTVVDQQGLPVTGARIVATLRGGTLTRAALSSTARFAVTGLTAGVYDARIEANGFAPWQRSVDLRTELVAVLEARLDAEGVSEQIIVTPTRTERQIGDVPASVHVLTAEEIQRSPAVVADDLLRQIPTFSLFRRTSSLAAHPTAQGVSLRGIGPSGVSRTLVLVDNIPFNDPFGGWVYWTRVPMLNTERIEVVDGATSSLYGNYAMGGVINIVTNRPRPRTLIVHPQYGNRGTPKVDMFASDVWNNMGVSVDATLLDTDGYEIVAAEERGPIDNRANVKYRSASARLDYSPSDRVRTFVRAGVFDEKRNNGKINEFNDTNWKYGSGGVRLSLGSGALEGNVFVDRQQFHSTFMAVPAAVPPRSQTNLTLDQQVPTNAIGAMAQWSHVLQAGGRSHVLAVGTDVRRIKGDSEETTFALPTGLTPILRRTSGGTQQIGGVFVQDLVDVTDRLQLTVSARVDWWVNHDAHNYEVTIATQQPTANNRELPDTSDTATSPRVAALYRVSNRVSVWGGVSRGFRAPTLNELYRQFRVGAILTLANETLGPERLTGLEGGVSVAPADSITVRGTWFNNRVTDPVANVTTTPNGNTRQRRNLGATNIGGFHTDVEYRPGPRWSLAGAYLFDLAKVHESARDAAGIDLTGRYLAQVPKHRGSVQASFLDASLLNATVAFQFVGHQFDDDQNVSAILPAVADKRRVGLPGYTLADVMLSRSMNPRVDLFLGVQNIFDTLYYVGTNPTTIGTPRLVNGGLRLRFGQ